MIPAAPNFAHQDKTVYDKIDGNEAGLEQLLPGAEEPQEKPRIISPYDNELPEGGQPKVVRVPPPHMAAQPAAPAAAPEVSAPEIPDPMGREQVHAGEGEDGCRQNRRRKFTSARPRSCSAVMAAIMTC